VITTIKLMILAAVVLVVFIRLCAANFQINLVIKEAKQEEEIFNRGGDDKC
jgi:hypothetical protein